jgi:predicted enzyme related to lactoylglutathione lyase
MRLTPLLTAAMLLAAPVAGIALPASAATCTTPTVKTQVAPRTVVVDSSGVTGFDIEVAVEHHGCAIGAVEALVTSPTKGSAKLILSAESGNETTTFYSGGLDLTAAELFDADAGTWKVRTSTAWAQDAAGLESEGQVVESSGKVSVLADADLTADATSAALRKGKISKGKVLTVKGTLTRARWEAGTSTGYAKQRVEVQFRTPKGTYKKVEHVTTRSAGTYVALVKAAKDGCYRVVFEGSKSVAPVASPGECIDVR